MKCCVCRKGPADGVDLYRVNAKGVAGIWACADHRNRTDAPPVDPAVADIVEAVTGKRP